MITVNRRFTRVPMASGVVDLMKTPVREMFVTYSWMNASNDSNSLLIVTRWSVLLLALLLSGLSIVTPHFPARSNCSRWYSVRGMTVILRM